MGNWEKEKLKLQRLNKGKQKKEELSARDIKELMRADRYERRKGRIRQR